MLPFTHRQCSTPCTVRLKIINTSHPVQDPMHLIPARCATSLTSASPGVVLTIVSHGASRLDLLKQWASRRDHDAATGDLVGLAASSRMLSARERVGRAGRRMLPVDGMQVSEELAIRPIRKRGEEGVEPRARFCDRAQRVGGAIGSKAVSVPVEQDGARRRGLFI